MIEPAKFALFIGVSWALILAPGPDMFYVITRGMANGRKAGMLSAIGVVCGILVHTTAAVRAKSSALFWQGVLSNVLNPKIAIFFLAFLPQFVDKGGNQVTLQLAILGITFACFGLCFLLVVGYSSGTIGRWLTYQPRYAQFFQRLAAGMLIGLGIRLAFTEK